MEEQQRIIGDTRFGCRLRAVLRRAARHRRARRPRNSRHRVDDAALAKALPPLRNTNRSKLPAAELAEIQDTLAVFESTARRASSRRERDAPVRHLLTLVASLCARFT
jgi:hypothetical protein